MNFDGFRALDFPKIDHDSPRFVYILFYVQNGSERPFYVGQTKRIWGRLDDYYWASFSAATDFRVGEAIRYLYEMGFKVVAKYKATADSLREEREIIEKLRSENCDLLNDQAAFNFRNADEAQERSRVRQWVSDKCIGNGLSATIP